MVILSTFPGIGVLILYPVGTFVSFLAVLENKEHFFISGI